MSNKIFTIKPEGKYKAPMKRSPEQREKKLTLDKLADIALRRELAAIDAHSREIG